MIISHIVAMAKNHIIGRDNTIPWNIPGELLRFKELTMNKTVIMGRKTYESLEKKLKGRRIIVISNTLEANDHEFILAKSIEEALDKAGNEHEVFIAGGGELYKTTLDMADKLYITVLDQEIEGTVFYPKIDKSLYDLTYEEHIRDASIPYTYYTYEKKGD